MKVGGWIARHVSWGRPWRDPLNIHISWRDVMIELDPALSAWRPASDRFPR